MDDREEYDLAVTTEKPRKIRLDDDSLRRHDLSLSDTDISGTSRDDRLYDPGREIIRERISRDRIYPVCTSRKIRLPKSSILEDSPFLLRGSSFLSVTRSSFFSTARVLDFELLDEMDE